ncbi:MAG: zinc-binding dehydrogenase [Actinomycetota bacterium]|nr:zinc-binding dehydrogenase [Actinomycetota bacterium]
MSPASMRNPTVVFRGPGMVEFEDRPLPTPGRSEVLLRTRRTLISPGTELTILSGDFAPGSAWDGYGQFPFVAGYSAAAEVAELGEDVEGLAIGDLVAAGTPHARWSTTSAGAVYPLRGAAVPIDLMPFVTLAATVMNGVRRGQVAWGDSVVVFGLGLLGQLAVRYCRLCGARPVLGVDLIDARIALLPPGVTGVHPERQALRDAVADATRGRMADVVFEATGDSQLIPGQFALLRPQQGRFVVLSSPRGNATQFDFHDLANAPSHTIIGAHISSHPTVETPQAPWTLARHAELFFDLVSDRELELEPLISHRLGFAETCHTYRSLLRDRSQSLGIVLNWD